MAATGPLFMMLAMFGVFWFIVIRPQVKRQKLHQDMLSALVKGDMVTTRGGLIGKVVEVTSKMITVELQEKVKVRILRDHVEAKIDIAALRESSEASVPAKKAA